MSAAIQHTTLRQDHNRPKYNSYDKFGNWRYRRKNVTRSDATRISLNGAARIKTCASKTLERDFVHIIGGNTIVAV